MDRRRFLASTAMAACSGVVNPANGQASAGQTEAGQTITGQAVKRRPNVLMLMSDQHKRSCMGACGDPVAITPNLDRLAANSVRFTNAYCTNPVCSPSRASLMTGLYSHNLVAKNSEAAFSPKRKTIAHHFNQAGYFTGLIGKMHWLDGQSHGFEYRLEFNDWLQYLGPKAKLYANELGEPNSGAGLPEIDTIWAEEGNPWKGEIQPDGRLGPVSIGRVSKLEEKDHFDSFVARESVRFLTNYTEQNQPFFLISSFLKPHDPFMPAERFAKMFNPEDMKLSPSWGKANLNNLPRDVCRSIKHNVSTPELQDVNEAKKRMAFYYANLAQMDDCVGQVVKAIDELELDRDTIICYMADHGEMLGDLGLWNKFQFYEGSCGVPLLIRVPGVHSGVNQTPVSLVSFCATITDLCGVKQIAPNNGTSFADLVLPHTKPRSHGPVFAEFNLGTPKAKYMIRDRNLKYTYWIHETPELYDLASDPEELHNLASRPEHAADISRMKQTLFAWHTPLGT